MRVFVSPAALTTLLFFFPAERSLNAIREICARCPLAMEQSLLEDLIQYTKTRDKGCVGGGVDQIVKENWGTNLSSSGCISSSTQCGDGRSLADSALP